MQSVFVTKYALSGGITEHHVDNQHVRDGYVYPGKPFMDYTGFKLGVEAFFSRDEAVAASIAARVRKIESLNKQIRKLEALSFSA